MSSACFRLFFAGAILFSGCVSATQEPESVFGAIRFSPDLKRQANDSKAYFLRDEYRLGTEIEEEHFLAFDAERSDGASVVRVITMRGVVLDMNAPSEDESLNRVRLDERVWSIGHERENGFLVEAWSPERFSSCFGVFRIGNNGELVGQKLPFADVGENACVERVDDLDNNRRPELLIVARVNGKSVDGLAKAMSVYIERAEQWVPLTGNAAKTYWRAKIELAIRQLIAVRHDHDVDGVVRTVSESVQIAKHLPDDKAQIAETLRKILDGLVLRSEHRALTLAMLGELGHG
ncbi:MAG: hypothetical protein R3A47_10290 [Polyangiales bacterium]